MKKVESKRGAVMLGRQWKQGSTNKADEELVRRDSNAGNQESQGERSRPNKQKLGTGRYLNKGSPGGNLYALI